MDALRVISAPLRGLAFYGSLAVFAAWAGAFNLVSAACAPMPATMRTEKLFQRLIHWQVATYFRWLRLVGAVRVEYRGGESMGSEAAVIVANHPGLLDAFTLLARVPRGFCIFKPAIRRNPILSAAARRAGYLANDRGLELVRAAAGKISRGASLIVFPEGTRTSPGAGVGPFRRGFAVIARRAQAPVQLVLISMDTALFARGSAWWKLPRLPVRIVVEAGPRLDPGHFASTDALVEEVETWFRRATCAELTRAPGAALTGA